MPKLLFTGGFSWTEILRAVLSPGCLWKVASRLPWSEGAPLSLVFTENLLVLSLHLRKRITVPWFVLLGVSDDMQPSRDHY